MNARTRLQRITRTEDGFTIPELLVTIFFLAVLAALVLPPVMSAQASVRESEVENKVLENQIIVQDWVADGGDAEDATTVMTEDIQVVVYNYLDYGYRICGYRISSGSTVGFTYDSATGNTYQDECFRFDVLNANAQQKGLELGIRYPQVTSDEF